jgi:ubiquinone biosynthesis protein Coq4
MLAHYVYNRETYQHDLKKVFAGMIGETYGEITLKADTWYSLSEDGLPMEVQ